MNKTTSIALDAKQQGIVTISALTAIGDIPNLKQALNAGLDAELTVNEIKEVLVQLACLSVEWASRMKPSRWGWQSIIWQLGR